MAILTVSNLSRHFGGLKAVQGMAFDVEAGTVFGIIGPNGAGKTTLFNLLTGFLAASGGSVRFHGREVLGRKPHRVVAMGIARSFQLVKPFLGMTVLETAMIPAWAPRARRRAHSPAARHALVFDRLAQIGLAGKSAVRVDDLNQGELRLLDIARAVLTEPEILFLDEPFSGLGQEHISQLSSIVNQLKQSGVTVVIIEHRLRELMRLVDHVMVMNFGQKLAEGHPAGIVRDPEVIEAYLGKGKHLDTIEG